MLLMPAAPASQVAALTVYMFCGWFTDRFVLVFVTLVLLLAFDFWAVKVRTPCTRTRGVSSLLTRHPASVSGLQNVTGRLLVGLRWWNNMKEDGTSEWVFESHQVRC